MNTSFGSCIKCDELIQLDIQSESIPFTKPIPELDDINALAASKPSFSSWCSAHLSLDASGDPKIFVDHMLTRTLFSVNQSALPESAKNNLQHLIYNQLQSRENTATLSAHLGSDATSIQVIPDASSSRSKRKYIVSSVSPTAAADGSFLLLPCGCCIHEHCFRTVNKVSRIPNPLYGGRSARTPGGLPNQIYGTENPNGTFTVGRLPDHEYEAVGDGQNYASVGSRGADRVNPDYASAGSRGADRVNPDYASAGSRGADRVNPNYQPGSANVSRASVPETQFYALPTTGDFSTLRKLVPSERADYIQTLGREGEDSYMKVARRPQDTYYVLVTPAGASEQTDPYLQIISEENYLEIMQNPYLDIYRDSANPYAYTPMRQDPALGTVAETDVDASEPPGYAPPPRYSPPPLRRVASSRESRPSSLFLDVAPSESDTDPILSPFRHVCSGRDDQLTRAEQDTHFKLKISAVRRETVDSFFERYKKWIIAGVGLTVTVVGGVIIGVVMSKRGGSSAVGSAIPIPNATFPLGTTSGSTSTRLLMSSARTTPAGVASSSALPTSTVSVVSYTSTLGGTTTAQTTPLGMSTADGATTGLTKSATILASMSTSPSSSSNSIPISTTQMNTASSVASSVYTSFSSVAQTTPSLQALTTSLLPSSLPISPIPSSLPSSSLSSASSTFTRTLSSTINRVTSAVTSTITSAVTRTITTVRPSSSSTATTRPLPTSTTPRIIFTTTTIRRNTPGTRPAGGRRSLYEVRASDLAHILTLGFNLLHSLIGDTLSQVEIQSISQAVSERMAQLEKNGQRYNISAQIELVLRTNLNGYDPRRMVSIDPIYAHVLREARTHLGLAAMSQGGGSVRMQTLLKAAFQDAIS